jgi:hypothetical protein
MPTSRSTTDQSCHLEHPLARDDVRLLAKEAQRHDGRVRLGERDVGAGPLEEASVDEVEPLGPTERDVAGDEGIEAAANLGRVRSEGIALENPADPLAILGGAADTEHRRVEPAPIRLHLRIFDPAEEPGGVHPALEFLDVGVGRDGELVVGVAGERVILVLEVILEEGQPVAPLLRQAPELSQVGDRPVADEDRTRPDELRRLDGHEQKQRPDRLVLEQDGFEPPGIRAQQSRRLDRGRPLEHLDDLELPLGERAIGSRRE